MRSCKGTISSSQAITAMENVGEERARERAAARKAGGLPAERAPTRGTASYLQYLAEEHPTSMAALLSRILPAKVEGDHQVVHTNTYQTFEQIAARLKELGLEPRRICDSYPLLEAKKEPDDDKVLSRRFTR
jgi:hypothetical protein